MSENKKTSHPVLKTAAIILITVMLLLSAVIIVPKVARRIENYQTFMTAKHRAEQIVSERYGTDYAVVDTRNSILMMMERSGMTHESKNHKNRLLVGVDDEPVNRLSAK